MVNYQANPWWVYQMPILGTAARMLDDERYWSDYQKNTGFTPRYPGRSYNSYGAMLFNQSMGASKSLYKGLK